METTNEAQQNSLYGILAEFRNPKELLDAARTVQQSGYKKYDAYTPFPIHGLEKAMNLKQSKLGWIVFFHAILGAGGALLLMIWTMGYDYPMNISGKPAVDIPAFIPVTFELTILLSAFGATFGMLYLNGLPKFHNPLFNSDRFEKVTDDSFFIGIEADDALFEQRKVKQMLEEAGAIHIEEIYEDPEIAENEPENH